jgi:hypothetical protein
MDALSTTVHANHAQVTKAQEQLANTVYSNFAQMSQQQA